jgi:hypothetical protein
MRSPHVKGLKSERRFSHWAEWFKGESALLLA